MSSVSHNVSIFILVPILISGFNMKLFIAKMVILGLLCQKYFVGK